MAYTDIEIVALCKDPDQRRRGFTLLMETYQHRLYGVVRRMVIHHEDANDVLQNTFLKVWQGLDSYREDARLFTWLYKIATNEAITHLNKLKKQYWVDLDTVEPVQSVSASTPMVGEQLRQKLDNAIDILPEKQRAIFVLRYFEEMSYEEMSKVLDTSVGALKASYHHAVKKVEHFLLAG